jgi:non-lysosomal glucosylceramidase
MASKPESCSPEEGGSGCCEPVIERRDFFRLASLAPALAAARFQTLPLTAFAQTTPAREWPSVRSYRGELLDRIAMPVGGIGTGSVSLAGNGALRDWEVVNRPAKGFTPEVSGGAPFFALWFEGNGQRGTRVLEGPLPKGVYEGSHGSRMPTHGLPRFASCEFHAAWPLARVTLQDSSVPLEVELRVFSPFIPPDEDASGYPMAVLSYRLVNPGSTPVRASVCGTLPNFVGMDGWETTRDWKGDRHPTGARQNRNHFRTGGGLSGLFMDSAGVDPEAEQWGSLALAVMAEGGVSHRLNWTNPQWGGALLDFWDDFSADGRLDPRPGGAEAAPVGSLASTFTLGPGESREVTFLICWHFPNRYSWSTPEEKRTAADRIGNYHTTRFADAWAVAAEAAPRLSELRRRTVGFVQEFCTVAMPDVVKEAALFNASTLVTQTCFRTPDGKLFGWEGTADQKGCCHGSCTHVWNYEQALAHLFGRLSWSMREVEFAHATDEQGLMSFRVNLPLSRATSQGRAAADGQMGCVMKVYRDWRLNGDDEALRRLWPAVRRAMEFCWIPGGWDSDRDGVMEGAQHNTMDVEYYGPNPQMGFWYVGALQAAARMAERLGERDFAATCRDLARKGSQWMDAHLFNGEYYIQEVRPPGDASKVAPSLLVGMGSKDLSNPDFQLAGGAWWISLWVSTWPTCADWAILRTRRKCVQRCAVFSSTTTANRWRAISTRCARTRSKTRARC